MRVVLVDLSAKYIHSGLAVKYLYHACLDSHPDICVIEETINRPIEKLVEIIYRENPQVVGFSCYIWNIETVLNITKSLAKLLPDLKIILGGPEVSYTPKDIMQANREIDYIICGEGEIALPKVLSAIKDKASWNIKGVYSKEYETNELTDYYFDLNDIPYPYKSLGKEDLANKIVYYECSRGCPYRCAYCLSGLAGKVRFLDKERVKNELFDLAVKKGVKQIKFVDRTFNHNKEYAYEIFSYLKGLECETNFHFEVRADIFDDKTLALLSDAPKGRFQFEIGIQSTNKTTLKAINRPHNWDKLSKNVKEVKSYNNIHQHLDLIAGLPYENLESFKNSFNAVFSLEPDMLQLGFLKLLKGSSIWQDRENYEYISTSYTPYEVLGSRFLDYDELIKLKAIEHVLELVYNSNHFKNTLNYIIGSNGFQFFEALSQFFIERDLDKRNHSLHNLFKIVYDFFDINYQSQIEIIRELLKLDYLSHFMHRTLPDYFKHIPIENYRQTTDLLLRDEKVTSLLAEKLQNKSEREILKQTHFEHFPLDINLLVEKKEACFIPSLVLFDYSERDKNFFSNKAVFHTLKNEK